MVVTGATSGIGRSIARRFAQDGAQIGLIARGREALENTKNEIEQAGGRALAIPTDLADWDAVKSAASAVEEALGPIDIWINNAMATIFAPFRRSSPRSSGARPKSPTSARYGARRRRSTRCWSATVARS